MATFPLTASPGSAQQEAPQPTGSQPVAPRDEAAALARFNELFTSGVRRGASGSEADVRAALELLHEAAALIDAIPAARRASGRLAVAVRRAEVLLRAGRHAQAAEVARAARDEARRESAWSGLHRVLAWIVLWQSLPDDAFRALAREEREWLFAADTLAEAKYLREPLQILRCDLQIGAGTDLPALRQLEQLAEDLRGRKDGAWRAWSEICFHRLARYYLERREYDRAAVWVDELPAAQSAYARALIALQRKDYAGAERAGLLLARGDSGLGVAGDPRYWQLVGDARESQRRYAEALAAYEQALAAAADDVDRAMARGGIGDCHLGLGDAVRATESYEVARALVAPPRAGGMLAAAQYAETLKDLGRAAEASGDQRRARECYASALDAVERAWAGIPVDLLGGAFLETPLGVGDSALLSAVDGVLRTCATSGAADVGRALAAMERGKAREMLEWMHRPPTEGEAQGLRRVVGELALARDGAEARRLLRELEELRSARGSRPPVAPLDAPALEALLAREPDTLVLAYWCGSENAWAVAARGGLGTARIVDLGPARTVLQAQRRAVEAVIAPAAAGDAWPRLEAAAAVLLPPALREPLARARRVVVCPDTTLWRTPFEALRVPDGEPLGIACALERAPSLSVRAALAARGRGRGHDVDGAGDGVLVLGGDAVPGDLAARLDLAPLDWFAREVALVQAAYGRDEVRVLHGERGTFAGLRAALHAAPADLIHVSAHAVVSAAIPSRTLLVLADGPVPMPTLATLDLRGAELVLSACSSAIGEDKGGAGAAGLLWGSLAAGARAVLAPLWHVGQQATADLLGQYHHARAAGADSASAMQAARRRLAAAPHYAHPFHWAGFTVVAGAPAPGAK